MTAIDWPQCRHPSTDRACFRLVRRPDPCTVTAPRSEADGPQVKIHRIHDTANMSKFACAFSPVIGPGETVNVGYVVSGGIFIHDHYFRQSMPAYTQELTLTLRHLPNCKVSGRMALP